ncbi:S53 family peptidase [Streptomyces sp. RPT161]|uniref:S53 family peptidase n=1 Tax=Streptomyces sp. RPT161 TaxID=3015993 RepID=UPI0022B86B78|nr:S53 family peptidase [Streptomyces sp. RPT161]
MNLTFSRRLRLLAGAALSAALAFAPAMGTYATAGPARTVPAPQAGPQRAKDANPVFSAPVSTSECRKRIGRGCYSPLQYRAAYDLAPLFAKGITGKGRTIVIVDSFGSPTIQHDLDVFDRQWGLPNTAVDVVKWGKVPPFNPKDPDQNGWADETTLDVEAAHAMAPGAHIVLVETAVAETEGPVGVPEMMSAINHLVNEGKGDVVSMSWATSEAEFPGFAQGDYTSLTTLRYAFANAARHGVTLTASSGDGGGHANRLDSAWPAGDPLVTAVGGTELHLDDAGKRIAPDSAWSGSGGDHSKVFARPTYQYPVRNVVGAHRGTPDISMAASTNGALWLYSSYDPTRVGWTAGGNGTSEASPLFAGIVALADQAAGHRLGVIDRLLYRLYGHSRTGLVDVTTGRTGPGGFSAGPGYDQATGLGTVDANLLVHALARRSAS